MRMALFLLLFATPVFAQEGLSRTHHIRSRIVCGRINIDVAKEFTRSVGTLDVEGYVEKTSADAISGHVTYEMDTATQSLIIKSSKDKKHRYLVTLKFENADVTTVFRQTAKGVEYEYGKATKISASSIWHLMHLLDADRATELDSLMRLVNKQWELKFVSVRTKELMHQFFDDIMPDVKDLDDLIEQMNGNSYQERSVADRKLRDYGLITHAYLSSLDMRQLEPEQRSRIREILKYHRDVVMRDTPLRIASLLAGDRRYWASVIDSLEGSERALAESALKRLTTRRDRSSR